MDWIIPIWGDLRFQPEPGHPSERRVRVFNLDCYRQLSRLKRELPAACDGHKRFTKSHLRHIHNDIGPNKRYDHILLHYRNYTDYHIFSNYTDHNDHTGSGVYCRCNCFGPVR